MTLDQGEKGNSYQIIQISTQDEELERFLLTLGCYPGETISLVGIQRKNVTITIRDGRYTLDKHLAESIQIEV